MFRLKTASADANQAGVAGMSDLVAAMHGDDAAAQIVIARLDETRGAQHLEQGFLVRDACGSIPRDSGSCRQSLAMSLPSSGKTLKE